MASADIKGFDRTYVPVNNVASVWPHTFLCFYKLFQARMFSWSQNFIPCFLTFCSTINLCYFGKNLNWANTVEPVYYGHLGTSQKCPDYQGVLIFQVSLHDNVSFGTTARCVDYAGVHIFKCPD